MTIIIYIMIIIILLFIKILNLLKNYVIIDLSTLSRNDITFFLV